MTLSLTCTCGVRLDVPENFAGQQLTCPDCQHPIAVPRADPALIKTSGLALASLVLALAGAFTVVGTAAAVVLGALALLHIRRKPGEVVGKRYAVAGITLGVALTGVTLLAYSSAERLGLRNLLGRAQWVGRLDYDLKKTIKPENEAFSFTRPSDRWGLCKKTAPKDGPVNPQDDRSLDELLLVNVEEDAHILVLSENVNNQTLDEYLASAREKFRKEDPGKIFGHKPGAATALEVGWTKRPPPVGSVNVVESLINKTAAGQERTFILRVVQKENDQVVFQIIAGARKHNFARVEPQLRKALDSFKVLDGP